MLRLYFRLSCGVCKSDRELNGKVVIVTGGNTGIGKELVRDLAKRQAKIILACRSMERGKEAMVDIISETGNQEIYVKKCDISSLQSVRQFCEDVLDSEDQLDVLVCFAGSGAPFGRHLTADGVEMQFATNHLGHFLLVNLLLDLMKATPNSRIVITSSSAHLFGKMDLENISTFDSYISHPFVSYCNTKLANIMFMKELHERLDGTGVAVNAVHPGTIYTNGIRYNKIWYIKLFLTFIAFLYNKSLEEGAQTLVYLAVSHDVDGISGQYFTDCKSAKYNPLADDQNLRKQLWKLSAQLCDSQLKKIFKRKPDDFGHLRFGRNDGQSRVKYNDPDYGHMRFG
ncbi:retinol dehydrogenase 11-like [Oppia nitens]|uniref:retinol dehydrogenase 11-like n=1 Tax=Oppia nitens TaxID=1686743 RepID=UPI0023DAA361|nr:retinol dehydrogenase 11-like [Oppia nitens]